MKENEGKTKQKHGKCPTGGSKPNFGLNQTPFGFKCLNQFEPNLGCFVFIFEPSFENLLQIHLEQTPSLVWKGVKHQAPFELKGVEPNPLWFERGGGTKPLWFKPLWAPSGKQNIRSADNDWWWNTHRPDNTRRTQFDTEETSRDKREIENAQTNFHAQRRRRSQTNDEDKRTSSYKHLIGTR